MKKKNALFLIIVLGLNIVLSYYISAIFSFNSMNCFIVLFITNQVATSCMDNSLLKYSAKDHFFRASICHMCLDTVNAQVAVKKYEEMFPAFADARECKLVKVSFCVMITDCLVPFLSIILMWFPQRVLRIPLMSKTNIQIL